MYEIIKCNNACDWCFPQEVDCLDESLQSHVSSAAKRLHNAMSPCLS